MLKQLGSARYAYLLRQDPERIERDQGVAVWRNFEWSDADETALQAEDPRVEPLLERKRELEESIRSMEGGDELRALVRASFSDPEFSELLTRFQEETQAVEQMLESSR